MERKLPKRRITLPDALLAGVIVLVSVVISLFIFGRSTGAKSATVKTASGSFEVSLDEDRDYTFSSKGYNYTAYVRDGEIWIVKSDCPDGICRSTRAVGRRDGAIVCVPGEVTITCGKEVSGNGDADIIAP
ncbi:MAG: NusG domain II-containing protein [Clostridia bacterium]|nr:NusG domain II-containing protein [Clostridia bacterium]